jgi:hypothetical protein
LQISQITSQLRKNKINCFCKFLKFVDVFIFFI